MESTDRGGREAQLRKAGTLAPVWPPWGVSLAHKTRYGSQLRPCPYHQGGQEEGRFLSCRCWHQLLPAPREDVSCLPSPCDSSRGGALPNSPSRDCHKTCSKVTASSCRAQGLLRGPEPSTACSSDRRAPRETEALRGRQGSFQPGSQDNFTKEVWPVGAPGMGLGCSCSRF